jgi:hypothetical protein
VTAYRRCSKRKGDEALRAHHLNRITSRFKTTISPEGSRRLARLLALDDDATQDE